MLRRMRPCLAFGLFRLRNERPGLHGQAVASKDGTDMTEIDPCAGVQAGMLASSPCLTCGHPATFHTIPGRICAICMIKQELLEELSA